MFAKKDKKFERTTSEQIRFYLGFSKAHPEMQGGKFNPAKPSMVTDLWEELAKNLNAMRGPTRSAMKWKESLTQWKSQTRCRARKAKWRNRMAIDESEIKLALDFEKETLQNIEMMANNNDEFLHLVLQDNSMSATQGFSEHSKAIVEADLEDFPQLGLQKKNQMTVSADEAAADTEANFDPLHDIKTAQTRSPILGTDSNSSSAESTAPALTFLHSKNKKRKKISPEAMMKEALESLKRRESRDSNMGRNATTTKTNKPNIRAAWR